MPIPMSEVRRDLKSTAKYLPALGEVGMTNKKSVCHSLVPKSGI